MRRTWLVGSAVVGMVCIGLLAVWIVSGQARRGIAPLLIPDVEALGVAPSTLAATFDGADAERPRIAIELERVATGLSQPTDIQFPPGVPDTAIVLEKQGRAVRVDLTTGTTSTWFRVDVASRSEMGLLGLAFAPDFATSGRFVVHLSPPGGSKSRLEAWRAAPDLGNPTQVGTVLEVTQPYPNHDGGQIRFGPDAHLYVALGDGGAGGDPKGNGQNGRTLLGSILRITPKPDGGYDVPADNPFVGDDRVNDAAFAIGLRNPWRFAFDPQGRLVVADVGQDAWEEVDLVPAGANMGWNLKEGTHCYRRPAPCGEGTVDPIWEYDHDEGVSITGGVVYTGRIEALEGRYLFGDFGSGRLWALTLPDRPGARADTPASLGRWPISISTFGKDPTGEAYVADFAGGSIYRLAVP